MREKKTRATDTVTHAHTDQVLKYIIPRDEISLTVKFNKSSLVLSLRQSKQTLGGGTSRLLRRQHLPSFPQVLLRRLCQRILLLRQHYEILKKQRENQPGIGFRPMSQLHCIRAVLTSFMGALVRSLNCFMRFIWLEEEAASALKLLEKIAKPPPTTHRKSALLQVFSSLL